VETTRLPRAILLAAAVAAGSAGPLTAQGEPVAADPSTVSVAAPRAVDPQQVVSPFSVIPDPVQSAGFRTSLSSTVSLAAPPDATPPATSGTTPLPMPNRVPPPPTGTLTPQYPAFSAPSAAPAWRWHGYGSVIVADPSPLAGTKVPTPNALAPTGSAVSAFPSAADAVPTSDWRQTGAVPAFGPPADGTPLPAPARPQPLSANEPAWKAGGERVALANPMYAGRDSWAPTAPIVTVSASAPAWRGPAVTLDAPRAVGTYVSRAVSEPTSIRPVSYTVPAPPPATPAPTPLPAAVRFGIERVCAGRGREVEVAVRGPTSLLVRLKVRHPADAEYLANAISRMPELAPYHVQFEMQVAK
jgi:hypothetical protein